MLSTLRNGVIRSSCSSVFKSSSISINTKIRRSSVNYTTITTSKTTNTNYREIDDSRTDSTTDPHQNQTKKRSKKKTTSAPASIFETSIKSIKAPVVLSQYSLTQILHLIKLKHNKFFTPKQISQIIQLAIAENKEVQLYRVFINRDYPISQQKYAVLRNKLRNHHDKQTVEKVYEMWATSDDPALLESKKQTTNKSRLLRLYSFDMIRSITHKYINLQDPIKSNHYFSLLTSRYKYQLENSHLTQTQRQTLISDFFETTTMFLVRLVNYQNIESILTSLMDNNMVINGSLINMMITSLRAKGQYDLIFELFKVIPKVIPSEADDFRLKEHLTREFFIALWHEVKDLKILLAYVEAIYPDSWSIIEQDLRLVSFAYNNSSSNNGVDLRESPELFKAEISDWFKFSVPGLIIPNPTLTVIYAAVLEHIGNHSKLQTSDTLCSLHARYMAYAETHFLPYSQGQMDKYMVKLHKPDSVVTTMFINKALSFPSLTPRAAFKILSNHETYLPNVPVPAKVVTMLFLHHGTPMSGKPYETFLRWFQKYNVSFSAEFCVAVIKKLAYVRDIEGVKSWCNRMRELGFVVKSQKLIDTLKKLNIHVPINTAQSVGLNRESQTVSDETEVMEEDEINEQEEMERFKSSLDAILQRLVEYKVKSKGHDLDLYEEVVEEMKKGT
ncbi:hypothetical protein WICPIJ_009263 [Wickerhamomyces pijperi]|uniref:Uncharacterized protein n=1 Tax=Wickerhamomyces pijperi TaxID=599730 RepID=A0A9P8PQP4_WICPI|nr:hypothetical protein WICPIJ_009263 [Wickerhamomyces pijperi]